MIQIEENIELDPISEGLIPEGVVSHYVVPKGAVEDASNFHNDNLGVMTFRPNLVSHFTPAATPVSSSLFQTTAGSNRIYWQEGTSLKYVEISSPGSVTTYTSVFPSSFTARYQTIQSNLLAIAGTTIKYTDGSATPANISGITYPAVTVDILNAGFQGRLWYASSSALNNRLYYSDVIPAAGVASTTGTSPYLTINAPNGDAITGLASSQQVLFAFCHNSIFRVYNTQSQDNSPCAFVGALNQEAIVTTPDGIYFYHPSGFYKLSSDGSAQSISNRIASILPYSGQVDVTSCRSWSSGDYVYFSFSYPFQSGGGTVNGSKVYRYTISTQVWTIYDFYKSVVTTACFGLSRTGTQYVFLLGTTAESAARFAAIFVEYKWDGTVSTTASGIDLSLTDIIASYSTHFESFGIENRLKQIQGLAIPHLNGNGFDISYQTDMDNSDEWTPIGRLDDKAVTLFKDFQSKPFNRIKFRVSGSKRTSNLSTYCWVRQPIIIKLSDVGI